MSVIGYDGNFFDRQRYIKFKCDLCGKEFPKQLNGPLPPCDPKVVKIGILEIFKHLCANHTDSEIGKWRTDNDIKRLIVMSF